MENIIKDYKGSFVEGKALYKEGKYLDAFTLLREAYESDPANREYANAYVSNCIVLGNHYKVIGKHQSSVFYLKKACEIAPSPSRQKSLAEAYLGLADIHIKKNDMDVALKCLTESYNLCREHNLTLNKNTSTERAKIYYKLASYCIDQGYNLAIDFLEEAYKNDKRDSYKKELINQLIVKGESLQSQSYFAEALRIFKRVYTLDTSYKEYLGNAYKEMAEYCKNKFEYKSALEYLKQANKYSPSSQLDLLMGTLYEKTGIYDKAAKYLSEAINGKLSSEMKAIAYKILGRIEYRLGNKAVSEEYFKKAEQGNSAIVDRIQHTRKKLELLSKAPVAPLNEKASRTVAQQLMSKTYSENDNINNRLMEVYNSLYKNQVLRDILTTAAIHTLNFTKSNIAIVDGETTGDFKKGTEHAAGYYNSKNSIVVATQLNAGATEINTREIKGTLVHEMTHQAMLNIFKNRANPFEKDDDVGKVRFDKVAEDTLKGIYNYLVPGNKDAENLTKKELIRKINSARDNAFAIHEGKKYIIDTIMSVYNHYLESQEYVELVVRVPEAIAYGVDKKDFEFVKPLYDYFMNQTLPKIKEHNSRHKFDILEIGDGPKR
jgi:tetratricopeptide (TPR) repeat protein